MGVRLVAYEDLAEHERVGVQSLARITESPSLKQLMHTCETSQGDDLSAIMESSYHLPDAERETLFVACQRRERINAPALRRARARNRR